jgi:hypothetical protein
MLIGLGAVILGAIAGMVIAVAADYTLVIGPIEISTATVIAPGVFLACGLVLGLVGAGLASLSALAVASTLLLVVAAPSLTTSISGGAVIVGGFSAGVAGYLAGRLAGRFAARPAGFRTG